MTGAPCGASSRTTAPTPAAAAEQLVAAYVEVLDEWNGGDVDDDRLSNLLTVLGERIATAARHLVDEAP